MSGSRAGRTMVGMNSTARHFIRHYVAWLLGMLVLGVPGEFALQSLGSSTSRCSRPC
jgi:hypothetical protein